MQFRRYDDFSQPDIGKADMSPERSALPKVLRKWVARLVNMVWPRMGWRRYGSLMRHRLGRMKGSPYSISAGFACGAAMSLTPLFGLHIILAVSISWLMRANVIAAALGTLVGNPWTYPFFLYWTYEIGCLILGHQGTGNELAGLTLEAMRLHPYQTLEPVLWPMAVGSLPLVIMVWCLTCWVLYSIIKRYKSQRLERRHDRALQLLRRMKAETDTTAKEE